MNYTNELREHINDFKDKNNGIVNFTIKELLYGINQKIDGINDRLIKGDKTISSHSTWIKAFTLAFGVVFAVLSYLLFV